MTQHGAWGSYGATPGSSSPSVWWQRRELILSPMVRLTRATCVTFALILLVFAVWALGGFGYPSAPAPIALNMVSKVLAFATAHPVPAASAQPVADRPAAGPGTEKATSMISGRTG